MLKKLMAMLTGDQEQMDDDSIEATLEIATAILMMEIMKADDHFDELEHETLVKELKSHFQLSDDILEEVIANAEHSLKHSNDLYQFTKIINDHYDANQKVAIIEMLWTIAYADSYLDPHEEHMIRRISDLLYVPHRVFLQCKHKVQEESAAK